MAVDVRRRDREAAANNYSQVHLKAYHNIFVVLNRRSLTRPYPRGIDILEYGERYVQVTRFHRTYAAISRNWIEIAADVVVDRKRPTVLTRCGTGGRAACVA